jgi:NAD+ synthetase
VKIALAQLSPVVGDYAGNVELIVQAARAAVEAGADVLVAPELALCGYPPRDLLERPSFIDDGLHALDALAKQVSGIELVVGFVDRVGGGRPLRNAAAVLRDGAVADIRHKRLLPSYDVFDEDRWFGEADGVRPVRIAGRSVGLTICEDIWADSWGRHPRYDDDPVATLAEAGVELILNLSASPWHVGKLTEREALVSGVAKKHGLPVLYCNQVGGNDELLFDGASLYVDATGELRARGRSFQPDLILCDIEHPERQPPPTPAPTPDDEAIRQALVMGVRDYAQRCGFKQALLGLSGGIDSALVCTLAAEALGPENVLAVTMPSGYSSAGSVDDSRTLADNLGVQLIERPIEAPFDAFLQVLEPDLSGRPAGVPEENLQARIRGTLLMALSNRTGRLLLTTGNKSELAVGYCTLYGDMNGGLAVISDLPKTTVYSVCRQINTAAGRSLIPDAILEKPPSAELRPDQTDQDSLPPYDLLDDILHRYVVERQSPETIVEAGLSEEAVHRAVELVRRNEYKRRQAAPGLRVTTKAFGMGRQMPIACRRTQAR